MDQTEDRIPKELSWLADPLQVRKVNASLSSALRYAQPLILRGVGLSLRHVTFGPGVYPKHRCIPMHHHERLQIEYCLSGRIQFNFENDSFVLTPGKGCLIAPRVPHAWKTETDLIMMGALVEVSGSKAVQFEQFLSQNLLSGPRFFSSDEHLMLVNQILQTLHRPALWQEIIAGNQLDLCLAKCLTDCLNLQQWKQARSEMEDSKDYHSQLICEHAIEFIQANYDRPIQVSDISLQVGVSPRHLSRLFRQHLHKSVKKTLTDIRLKKAGDMLRSDPTLSVKEVAYATGFSSPAYFTYCFRKNFGILPSSFRP